MLKMEANRTNPQQVRESFTHIRVCTPLCAESWQIASNLSFQKALHWQWGSAPTPDNIQQKQWETVRVAFQQCQRLFKVFQDGVRNTYYRTVPRLWEATFHPSQHPSLRHCCGASCHHRDMTWAMAKMKAPWRFEAYSWLLYQPITPSQHMCWSRSVCTFMAKGLGSRTDWPLEGLSTATSCKSEVWNGSFGAGSRFASSPILNSNPVPSIAAVFFVPCRVLLFDAIGL